MRAISHIFPNDAARWCNKGVHRLSGGNYAAKTSSPSPRRIEITACCAASVNQIRTNCALRHTSIFDMQKNADIPVRHAFPQLLYILPSSLNNLNMGINMSIKVQSRNKFGLCTSGALGFCVASGDFTGVTPPIWATTSWSTVPDPMALENHGAASSGRRAQPGLSAPSNQRWRNMLPGGLSSFTRRCPLFPLLATLVWKCQREAAGNQPRTSWGAEALRWVVPPGRTFALSGSSCRPSAPAWAPGARPAAFAPGWGRRCACPREAAPDSGRSASCGSPPLYPAADHFWWCRCRTSPSSSETCATRAPLSGLPASPWTRLWTLSSSCRLCPWTPWSGPSLWPWAARQADLLPGTQEVAPGAWPCPRACSWSEMKTEALKTRA